MNYRTAIKKVKKRRAVLIEQAIRLRDAGANVKAELLRAERAGVSYALSQMEQIDHQGKDFRLFIAWLKSRITRVSQRSVVNMNPKKIRAHHARMEELLAVHEAAMWHFSMKRDESQEDGKARAV